MTTRPLTVRRTVVMMSCLLVSVLVLFPVVADARSINDATGRTSFAWLKAYADAAISSSGECFAARDGLAALMVHPAAVAGIGSGTVKMSYASYYVDSQFGSIGYARRVRGRDLAVRVSYLSYGDFEGRSINNEPTGTFTAGDMAFTVNMGRVLRDDLKVGIMLTYLTSRIDDFTAQAATVDAGLIYYPPFEGLTVGAALMNVGTVLEGYSSGYDETLPTYLSVGARKTLSHAPVTFFTDVQFPNDYDITYAYGLEVTVGDRLFLHAGTRSRSTIDREELKSGTDFGGRTTFGFSLDVSRYRFDYAYCPDSDLNDIHKVTLSAGLLP